MLNTNRQTKELKIAEKISDSVNDLTLDLDQIGIYIASNNEITYRRLKIVMESADFQREERLHNEF